MKSKLIIILCLIGILTPITKTVASEEIILKKEVGEYNYSVQKKDNNYVWDISYKNSNSTLKETDENRLYLERFRDSLNKLGQQKLKLCASIIYTILLLLFSIIILVWKRLKIPKWFLLPISILLIISIYSVLQTTSDLYVIQEDIDFIYQRLIQ
ncbi:hypothetical protein ACIQHV_28380 [Bacillus bombysepticus]|uniref:Uncharacterized protein n=1 Tax=Bacillus thuringiensis serovar kumamotoensis TaxID=132267 RepID=A0A9X6JIT5_BACUK|nr:hypothetical protein [Bacillus thuringiensis]MEC2870079.1 hypothetical protein [Bacillus cereus]OTZ67114.1 hypothetical protein BK769_31175 [Bacillus thuringiensis serovar kumamtoensis]HDR4482976.1 hypothetical protein [Bacillus cereus]